MSKSFLCLLSLAALLSACQQPVEEAAAPRPVWVMTVGSSATPAAASYTGEVKSRFESSIGFRMAGKIISRAVNVGDMVQKGQVIAQLDPSDSRLNAQGAAAEVQSAQANLALAQSELARRQQLLQQQFISKSALESYETQVKTARARLQQVQSQAALSQRQSGYATLTADRAGVIGMIQAEPGQVVAAGQTVAQIYDLHTLEILIAVPETVIGQLQVGDAAQVMLTDSANARYAGRIREISPAANSQTHAFDLRIQLLQADARLKLGMTAQVQFALNADHAALMVPSTAVSRQGEHAIVWVIDGQQRAHARQVTTGALTEQGVTITSGLQAQETIATIGVHTLTEGMLVDIVHPAPEVLR